MLIDLNSINSSPSVSFLNNPLPMSDGKISFSFGGKPAAKPSAAPSNLDLLMAKAKKAPPPKKQPIGNLFGDEEEDDGPRAGPSKTTTKPSKPPAPLLSRAERKAQQEALKIDQSVFDYDGVFDGMKAAERELEAARKEESADKKPKYIESFLQAAATRRLDRLRAEEKMLSIEREKEGDEFADKEKFVTEAYKKQMEEVRKAEEEEKQREGESKKRCWANSLDEARKGNRGPGLSSLYKTMLEDDAAKHSAAVAATTAKPAPGPSLAIRPPPQPSFDDDEEYDPLLAREAKSAKLKAGSTSYSETTGKHVEVNDEGEIVDKRSLLKAGLNITKKPAPAPALPNSLLTGAKSAPSDQPYVSRAVGSAASYQERMARERKRLAEQMRAVEEEKRAAAEQRQREEEAAALKRREGDDGEAARRRQEAKERFLARKREREDEERAKKRRREEE